MSDEPGQSVPTTHFDRLYAGSDDPWEYERGAYEQQKYARTLAALPRHHYASGFELGCSIGVLTAKLARRCDHILAADCSAKAIDLAQRKHAAENIEFAVIRAPEGLPLDRRFDLVVLSEVLYFFSPEDLQAVAAYVGHSADHRATIAIVNFLGPTEHAASGDQSADAFIAAASGWSRRLAGIREAEFRIDILERH